LSLSVLSGSPSTPRAMSTVELIKENQKANELLQNGHYKEAEPLLRAVVERTREENSAESWMWMTRLVEAFLGQDKFQEAEQLANKTLRSLMLRFGPKDEDVLDCQYLHAEALVGIRKRVEALPLAQAASEGLEANLKRGPEHLTTLKCKALYAKILKFTDPLRAKEIAESVSDTLEAVDQRSKAVAAAGGCRPTVRDSIAASKVKDLLNESALLTVQRKPREDRKPKQTATASTEAPDSEEDDLKQA